MFQFQSMRCGARRSNNITDGNSDSRFPASERQLEANRHTPHQPGCAQFSFSIPVNSRFFLRAADAVPEFDQGDVAPLRPLRSKRKISTLSLVGFAAAQVFHPTGSINEFIWLGHISLAHRLQSAWVMKSRRTATYTGVQLFQPFEPIEPFQGRQHGFSFGFRAGKFHGFLHGFIRNINRCFHASKILHLGILSIVFSILKIQGKSTIP